MRDKEHIRRYEVVSWCWKNEILISAEAIPTPKKFWAVPDVRLVYHIKGRTSLSKKVFEQDSKQKRIELSDKIQEAYEFYKNKYDDSIN